MHVRGIGNAFGGVVVHNATHKKRKRTISKSQRHKVASELRAYAHWQSITYLFFERAAAEPPPGHTQLCKGTFKTTKWIGVRGL